MFLACGGGLVLGLLSGCAATSSVLDSLGPVGRAMAHVARPALTADSARLLPGFEYLRVQVRGRQSLMVLGQRVVGPEGTGGPEGRPVASDEYWYSPQSELMQLRDGRLWRVMGMTTEWRRQEAQAPAWHDVPASGDAVAWVRQVDRMPGYRWAERDEVRTRRVQPPTDVEAAAVGQRWPQAQWFEDAVHSRDGVGRPWAFVQRFALWQGQVVYSEQCIAPDLCVALMRLEGPSR